MRKFLWGGVGPGRKTCWVSWDRVSDPIDKGGLGIRKLAAVNRALIAKWAWRFKVESNSLWVKTISAIHSHRGSCDFLPAKASLGGAWKNIVSSVDKPVFGSERFRHIIKGVVGNGSSIAFWLDPWLCKDPLRLCFPNLFALELDKKCVVRERIGSPFSNPMAGWKWKKPPDSDVELAEWSALCVLLRYVILTNGPDKWMWTADSSGLFSVKSTYASLIQDMSDNNQVTWEWCRWIPIKCNVFAWRAVLERLPTRVELRKRNLILPDSACPLCLDGEETASHLFTACSFSTAIWLKICSWCKVPFPVAFSFKDIVEAFRFSGLKGEKLRVYQGLVIITCWSIWCARNELVFNDKVPKIEEVFCAIRSIGFLWYKNRTKCIDYSWEDWCKFL
ncbi:putative reverse transcriptase zinc-binding domain-containing protein [Helianthus anomalus]